MKRFAIRFNAPVVLSFAILSLLVLVLDSATGGAPRPGCSAYTGRP